MCAHYEDASDINRLLAAIGLSYGEPEPFDQGAEYDHHPTLYAKPKKQGDMWPRYPGRFIRRHLNADVGDEAVPELEVVAGRWGLISAHTKPGGIEAAAKLSTYNARSEKVRTAFTYRHAWSKAQTCIIPATAFYEPDWRSGKAVPTRFMRADDEPLGIAGIWDRWRTPEGTWLESYTMPTINADEHDLMRDFHKPTDEKRMIVALPRGAFSAWLNCKSEHMMEFMQPFAAAQFVARPAS